MLIYWKIRQLFCRHRNSYGYVFTVLGRQGVDMRCDDCGKSWIDKIRKEK